MALSSNDRWIAVGNLTIRNHAKTPHYAPEFVLGDFLGRFRGGADDKQIFVRIKEVVERIKDGTISSYAYDPQKAKLMKRAGELGLKFSKVEWNYV